jgi:putative heme-binding domain-containing protein
MSNCINDIRGPFLGPDGWLYYAKGGASEVEYGSPDQPQKSKARHFFRRHPRGQLTEPVMTGGMDNPVELTFLPGGERIYTATNFQILGQPRRDGVGHAVMGALVPKDISDVFEFPWSMPHMYDQPLYQSGALAVSGITYCQIGPWPGNVVFAEFSGRRVTRLEIQPQGGSFAATPQSVLNCDDITFHPTDVIEDGDGSLLVLDTGGWYLHCCPSSGFFVPDAKGGIYRIRTPDTQQVEDPFGLTLDWRSTSKAALAARLGDPRPAVRKRALHQLATHGEKALDALEKLSGNVEARENAVWVASQVPGAKASALVRAGLSDPSAQVRHAALNVISLQRDGSSAEELIHVLLNDSSNIARRLAAEALGRCKLRSSATALIAAYDAVDSDPAIDHALGLALIEVADQAATRAALQANNPRVRRAALMALEQMADGCLSWDDVRPHLLAAEATVSEAAWWIVARHATDWGNELAGTLDAWFTREVLSEENAQKISNNLARVARSSAIQEWMAAELNGAETSENTQIVLMQAMSAHAGVSGVHSWYQACSTILQNRRSCSISVLLEATRCLAAMPPLQAGKTSQPRESVEPIVQAIRAAAEDSHLPPAARLNLLRSLRGEIGPLTDAQLDFLLTNAAAEQVLNHRAMAADAIVASELNAEQQRRLALALPTFAASEVSTVLPKFTDGQDDILGTLLLTSLSTSTETSAINPLRLKSVLSAYSDTVQRQAQPLIDKLAEADRVTLQRAERILELVPSSNPENGHALFHHAKTACVNCHVAVLVGGNIGPSLRGLGQRRSEQDILESILFPSASLVQSYEAWIVTTYDGSILQGVMLRDTPDAIELGNASGTHLIARENVEAMKRSEVSIMPNGLEKNLTDEELAALVAYLKSLNR